MSHIHTLLLIIFSSSCFGCVKLNVYGIDERYAKPSEPYKGPCPPHLHHKDNITQIVNHIAMKSFYSTSIKLKDPLEEWTPYQKSNTWLSVCSEGNANGTIHVCQTSVQDVYLLHSNHPNYTEERGELNPHFKLDYLQFTYMLKVDYEGNARPFLPKCFAIGQPTNNSLLPASCNYFLGDFLLFFGNNFRNSTCYLPPKYANEKPILPLTSLSD